LWDGINGNEPTLPSANVQPRNDLLFADYVDSAVVGQVQDPVTGQYQPGLLLGDYNRSGTTEFGETTIFFTLPQAQQLLSSAGSKDLRYGLVADLVAGWLNYLSGNRIDTVDPSDKDARFYLNSGINWVRALSPDENGDGSGDGAFDGLVGSTVKSPSANGIWTLPLNSPLQLPAPYAANGEDGFPLDSGQSLRAGLSAYNSGLGLADGVFRA
jgi:hypothetical protein